MYVTQCTANIGVVQNESRDTRKYCICVSATTNIYHELESPHAYVSTRCIGVGGFDCLRIRFSPLISLQRMADLSLQLSIGFCVSGLDVRAQQRNVRIHRHDVVYSKYDRREKFDVPAGFSTIQLVVEQIAVMSSARLHAAPRTL